MSLDGFLTFLTLIIAAYGIAPSVMQLRMRLHMPVLLTISCLGFLLVCWLEIFPKGAPCLFGQDTLCRYLAVRSNLDPDPARQLAFVVVMGWLALAWLIFANKRLWANDIPTLQRLVDELIYEQKYAELTKVIDPHLRLVVRVAERQFWGARAYDALARLNPHRSPLELLMEMAKRDSDAPEPPDNKVLNAIRSFVAWLGRRLPDARKVDQAAKEILRVLLLTPEFVKFVAVYRTTFGVRLLAAPVSDVHGFCDMYFVNLISNPASTLYQEIRNNQNLRGRNNYDYPEENKLLHFLFSDANQAKRLSVWKPVGEWLIAYLRPRLNNDYIESLNFSSDGFQNEEAWKDPAYVVIWFFDLMVSAAEHQGIEWHMWLYYFPHFAESFVDIYDETGPDVDPMGEFPTRLSYVIYEMFNVMKNWILAVEDLPDNSPHLRLESERASHDNGNIPKSAILALSECLSTVLRADKIGDGFKQTIFSVVVATIDRLPTQGSRSGFRRVLITALMQEGSGLGGTGDYLGQIRSRFLRLDHILRGRLTDFAAALE